MTFKYLAGSCQFIAVCKKLTLSTDCITLFRSSLVRLLVSALPDLEDISANVLGYKFLCKMRFFESFWSILLFYYKFWPAVCRCSGRPRRNKSVQVRSLKTFCFVTTNKYIFFLNDQAYFCLTSY